MKVFGIGLNKTGTSSLHSALELLGHRSLHGGDLDTHERMMRAIDDGKPMLSYLDPAPDAVCDVLAITYYFYLADRQYPDSKFILTLRDIDEWLDSRRRHVERNQRMKEARQLRRAVPERRLRPVDGGVPAPRGSRARLFRGRPGDLLAFRPTDGKWEPLCAFLGHDVPDVPFPWENRDRSGRAVNNYWAFADMTASNDLLGGPRSAARTARGRGLSVLPGADPPRPGPRPAARDPRGPGRTRLDHRRRQARRRRSNDHARPRGRRGVLRRLRRATAARVLSLARARRRPLGAPCAARSARPPSPIR